jgi:hypothetical protein
MSHLPASSNVFPSPDLDETAAIHGSQLLAGSQLPAGALGQARSCGALFACRYHGGCPGRSLFARRDAQLSA